MAPRSAFYFGYAGHGHYLHDADLRSVHPAKVPDFPRVWTDAVLDTGLLKNGKHPDVIDGKVFWTLGGKPLWFAFFWWDRSGDRRPNSHSGFYVLGFDVGQEAEAFAFACETFPAIVTRQRVSLALAEYPGRSKEMR